MATAETLPAIQDHRPEPLAGYSIADIERLASQAARSKLFPVGDPSAAFTLMMMAQAEGIHPMLALKRYHVIEGKPSMRADAMQAEFQARGGRIEWLTWGADEAAAIFSHPQHHPKPIRLAVTMAEMRQRGIASDAKKNWKQHPAAMLRARLISAAVRMIDPSIVAGIYTPEEVRDFGDRPEPPDGPVIEMPPPGDGGAEAEAAASPAAPIDWQYFAETSIEGANRSWDSELEDRGIQPRKGWEALVNRWQLAQHVAGWGVWKGMPEPEKRTAQWAEAVCARLWRKRTDQVVAEVERYLAGKLETGRSLHRIDDGPEAEEEGQEPAVAAEEESQEPGGRQPGEDG